MNLNLKHVSLNQVIKNFQSKERDFSDHLWIDKKDAQAILPAHVIIQFLLIPKIKIFWPAIWRAFTHTQTAPLHANISS